MLEAESQPTDRVTHRLSRACLYNESCTSGNDMLRSVRFDVFLTCDYDKPVAVSDAQRPQDDGVRDTEDGGVNTDTKGER